MRRVLGYQGTEEDLSVIFRGFDDVNDGLRSVLDCL